MLTLAIHIIVCQWWIIIIIILLFSCLTIHLNSRIRITIWAISIVVFIILINLKVKRSLSTFVRNLLSICRKMIISSICLIILYKCNKSMMNHLIKINLMKINNSLKLLEIVVNCYQAIWIIIKAKSLQMFKMINIK